MLSTVQGRALFFDTDTKQTFSVTPQQYEKAARDYYWWTEQIKKSGAVCTVNFTIETETGAHHHWIYRFDEDYSNEVRE